MNLLVFMEREGAQGEVQGVGNDHSSTILSLSSFSSLPCPIYPAPTHLSLFPFLSHTDPFFLSHIPTCKADTYFLVFMLVKTILLICKSKFAKYKRGS